MTETTQSRRCAVIANPTKVSDGFRALITDHLTQRGWAEPLWLETTEDDPGRAMTEQAISEGVDLVVGAGGDGTIRVVAAGLVGTDIEFGLIPAGTGNLLARNLAIPLDEAGAIEVALGDEVRRIDMIKLTVDDARVDHFAVMAGVGVDAVLMEVTDPKLKKLVGSAAYFVAAGKALGRLPLKATITVDGGKPIRRKASLCVIGNVGKLQADVALIPDASVDDGLLDVLVASPRRARDWVRLVVKVLLRRQHDDDQVDRLRGRSVRITVSEKDYYQMDGDTEGECRSLTAEVVPGALAIKASKAEAESKGVPS